ncbi:MAG: secretin N-terminal domain-containing protein [Oligoflexales bacterium]
MRVENFRWLSGKSFALWFCLFFSASSFSKQSSDGDISLNIHGDVELKDLVEMSARWKKKNILIDSKLKGKVRLYTHSRMSEQEVWEMVLATLRVTGFTVLETSRLLKVVPTAKVREQHSLMLNPQGWTPNSETLVTKLVPLHRGDAQLLQKTLKPLMVAGDLLAFEKQNALLVMGAGVKVRQVEDLIKRLDAPAMSRNVQIVYLKFSEPSQVAQKIEQMVLKKNIKDWQCLAFNEIGAVVLSGRPRVLKLLTKWVRKLDGAPRKDGNGSAFRVFPLFHTDVKVVARDISTLYKDRPQHDHPQPGENRRTMTLTPWEPGNSLLMTGTFSEQKSLARLLRKLDKARTQVYLDIEIVDVSDFHGFQYETKILDSLSSSSLHAITGWNAAAPLAVAGASSDDQTAQGTTASALAVLGSQLVFGVLGAKGVRVPGLGRVQSSQFIDLLKQDTRNRSLSSIQLLAVEGQESKMAAGETVFLKTEQPVGSVAAGAKYEKEEVGLELELTPHVSQGKKMTLEMNLVQTSFVAPQDGARATIRQMKTKQVFAMKDRQTLVVAGLDGVRELEEVSKIPLFGDIPMLGALFRSSKSRKQGSQIMVFVTPHVVYDASHLSDSYAEGRRHKRSASMLSSERLRDADPRKGM